MYAVHVCENNQISLPGKRAHPEKNKGSSPHKFARAESVCHPSIAMPETGANQDELACVYAALILHDDGIPITVYTAYHMIQIHNSNSRDAFCCRLIK